MPISNDLEKSLTGDLAGPSKKFIRRRERGLYKRGNIWYMDFTFKDRYGHKCRRREPTGTANKKLALDFLSKRRAEIAEGKYLDLKTQKKVKFKDFSEIYLAKHSSKNRSYHSDKDRMKGLVEYFGDKFLHTINHSDIEEFRTKLLNGEGKLKPATVNRYIALLRSLFNRAIEWDDYRGLNPAAKIKKLKENNEYPRSLSKEEIDRLYSELDGELLAIVKFALGTGLRRNEILSLTWQDVDIHARKIYVRAEIAKSGKARIVPMSDGIRMLLLSLKKLTGSNRIFSGIVRYQFEGAVKRAALHDCTFHKLRHTFATYLLRQGVDIVTVARWLGHSPKSMNVTMRYLDSINELDSHYFILKIHET
jgi:integrase